MKILDFGLAKTVVEVGVNDATQTQDSMSRPGTIAGTLQYMAPEQLRGQPIGPQADVWALGVILYEMAAGALPFRGNTAFEISASVLNQDPPALPAGVPPALQRVISRCLEKNLLKRYSHASELRTALEAARADLTLPAEPSRLERIALAVLPFKNISGDPNQEFLSDGLTEEMIMQLGRLHPQRLGVIARTSAMRYKGTDKSIDQIGRELGVDYVLEGSIARESGRVRVTAQLIHVRDQMQLWADSFERAFAGILVLQSEIARGVAKSLALALLPAEQATLERNRSVNPEAYEAYLKGCFHWYKLTPHDVESARQYFELAREKDPEYALAYVGMSNVFAGLMAIGAIPPREARSKARVLLQKAMALDDSRAEVHHLMATFSTWVDWDWAAGEAQFLRAIDLNPNYADARNFYSLLLTSLGRFDESQEHRQRALALDPHNFFFRWIRGFELLLRRQYDEAITDIQASLKLEPSFLTAHWGLWDAYHAKGLFGEALEEVRAVLPLFAPGVPSAGEALTRGYTAGGYQAAMRCAADELAAHAGEVYVKSDTVAELYACAGESELALHWLEKAHHERRMEMVYLAVKPVWDNLRNDARFRALLHQMNLSLHR